MKAVDKEVQKAKLSTPELDTVELEDRDVGSLPPSISAP